MGYQGFRKEGLDAVCSISGTDWTEPTTFVAADQENGGILDPGRKPEIRQRNQSPMDMRLGVRPTGWRQLRGRTLDGGSAERRPAKGRPDRTDPLAQPVNQAGPRLLTFLAFR